MNISYSLENRRREDYIGVNYLLMCMTALASRCKKPDDEEWIYKKVAKIREMVENLDAMEAVGFECNYLLLEFNDMELSD